MGSEGWWGLGAPHVVRVRVTFRQKGLSGKVRSQQGGSQDHVAEADRTREVTGLEVTEEMCVVYVRTVGALALTPSEMGSPWVVLREQ